MQPSSRQLQLTLRKRTALLFILAVGVVLMGTSMGACAASVEVKDGNVVFLLDGQQRQLTKSGKDASPVLSPDGKWVIFKRIGNPEATGAQGDCKSGAQADELRRIRVDGTGEEVLVRGHDSGDPKQSICYFGLKQFTSDGRFFFLSSGWVVSMGLHRYDTRTKTLIFVMDANDVIVLNNCKKRENRDNLVVRQHRYFILGGSYDWYWLFDPTGQKEKGPIGVYEDGIDDDIISGLCER